jgi:hypothetical protein
MMDKELIDQLWNRALRESIENGEQFTRYRFAQLVFELGVNYGPDYKNGYADGAFEERDECAKAFESQEGWLPVETVVATIRARGNN